MEKTAEMFPAFSNSAVFGRPVMDGVLLLSRLIYHPVVIRSENDSGSTDSKIYICASGVVRA